MPFWCGDVSLQQPHFPTSEGITQSSTPSQPTDLGLNRELATGWAELVTSLSGSVREQADRVGGVVTDQVEVVADLASTGARKAQKLAEEQAAQAEEAAREQEREVKRAERAAAKQAREAAREPYEGLTKVELSDQLAERGLPKSGTVEELIERLVDADSQ